MDLYQSLSLTRARALTSPILQIKDQHSAYLRKELTAMREKFIQDTRIHCCLFFINPTGHSLKPVRPPPPLRFQPLQLQGD